MTRRDWALKLLGVGPSATEAQIKEAYRDLVGVWHPDKHASNERVRAKAEEMMKRLNEAKDILLGGENPYGRVETDDVAGEPPKAKPPPKAEPPPKPEEPKASQTSEPKANVEPPNSEKAQVTEPSKVPVNVGRWVVALAVVIGLGWTAFADAPWENQKGPAVVSAQSIPLASNPVGSEPIPKADDSIPIEETQVSTELDSSESSSPGKDEFYIVVSCYSNLKEREAIRASNGIKWNGQEAFVLDTDGARANGLTNVKAGLSAVTIGPFNRETAKRGAKELGAKFPGAYLINLSSGESISVEEPKYLKSIALEDVDTEFGEPAVTTVRARVHASLNESGKELCRLEADTRVRVSRIDGSPWVSVALSDERRGFVKATQLRFENAVATASIEPKLSETFTLGSTEEMVRAVQGAPTAIHGDSWSYGYDDVRFKDGKVYSYSNHFKGLKVSVLPETATENAGSFQVGSSKNDVLAVQGTPTAIHGDSWSYGYDDVRFKDGKVYSYSNHFKGLKIK